ncbi:hypothetical protein L226DRAFT_552708 [Lentinus tigrinus ALCF2SS1-7]|uniref:uncharacterized protein n=1 Tax=Lentinus tigrinus ALCF2SS1-7 TaxID=1328758 RepID=UPI001165D3EE|nr:hypothetical protein L226DRAFT_552708 [Lentinus tigrinus ALCF2SS1-7]
MPIATAEREDEDNKDRDGHASARVLAVTNCHVTLRKNTAVPYQYNDAGAPRRHVRLAGFRRFQRGLDEITSATAAHATKAVLLTRDIVDLHSKLHSEDAEEAEEATAAITIKHAQLEQETRNIAALEHFHDEVCKQWANIKHRDIGYVDWAPRIAVDVDDRSYTKDIGTFEVDAERFRAQFKGNVVDLGAKYTSHELANKFYSDSNRRTAFKFPTNGQLRIHGCRTPEDLANPDTYDSNGEPCVVVMKDGNTSDLTVGRYAGLEAYTCDNLGVESIELAIYNYDKQSGSFSAKGDSGSLVFDGQGRMVGILHSGLAQSGSNYVTYATPAWWVIEQLKLQYPHANFDCDHF